MARRSTARGASAVDALRSSGITWFAFVMATGIISSGLWAMHRTVLSRILLLIAAVAYVVLCGIHLVRLWRWQPRVLAEMIAPGGFTFLTFTAASGVLSDRLSTAHHTTVAAILLAVAAVSWIVLGYGIPLGMISHARRHTTLAPVNGTWFIWIVGTQSVAVASVALADVDHHSWLRQIGEICWAIGFVQYLLLAGVEFARLLLRRIGPAESIAPLWVFMGSGAITVLAGAYLLPIADAERLISSTIIEGLSVILWSFTTWLIPLLAAVGIWRTIHRHKHVDYRTEWWAIVFPIGMYGAATRELGTSTHHQWMIAVGDVGVWCGLGAWSAVVVMFVVHEWRSVRPRRVPGNPASGPAT
jgi:tellurite resistance protein TehA-like permease